MSQAAAQERGNMTSGSILKKILLFALPILAGNLLQELYSVVDTLIVGQTLGVDKLAAVGATGPLSFLVIGFIMGLTSGCAVLTSKAFGANDTKALKQSVAAHFAIAGVFTVLLTAIFLVCAAPLLSLLNTTADSFEYARIYIMLIYAGIPATMLYNLLASLLRAVGDSKTPLVFLAFSSVLNIGLDLLFILAFRWDVAGVAIATVAAQLISGALCFFYIRRKAPQLLPDRQSFRDLKAMVVEELKVGIPLGVQHCFIALGSMVLQFFLNGFGSDAVAAYTVGSRIQGLIQNPIVSMSAVMATYVGQNAGAHRLDRIREGVKKSLVFTFLLAVVVSGLVWIFAKPVTMLFVRPEETAVIALVKQYLDWCCPFLWLLSLLFVCRGALQGLGDGVTSLLSSVLELTMRTAIPLLFSAALGYVSICIAGTAAWGSCAIMIALVYLVRIRKEARKPEYAAIQG